MTFWEKIFVESTPDIVASFRRSYKVLGSVQLMADPMTENEKQDYIATISRSREALLHFRVAEIDGQRLEN